MSGPDEISDDDYNSLDSADIDEQLADEARSDSWMRNDGIDSIPWPKAIAIRPVEVSDELLKIARKRLARMAV